MGNVLMSKASWKLSAKLPFCPAVKVYFHFSCSIDQALASHPDSSRPPLQMFMLLNLLYMGRSALTLPWSSGPRLLNSSGLLGLCQCLRLVGSVLLA